MQENIKVNAAKPKANKHPDSIAQQRQLFHNIPAQTAVAIEKVLRTFRRNNMTQPKAHKITEE